ncbi:hypothetical protein ANCCAN_24430 [Ancylostoma caninum]|uniref:Uncharacterized protein n=1 Tax=Ancylostoma caninum TaxID=29170 RepID=A0A368FCB3_ANCCA|nr:hypothetical protein ANCCAN_24430 [Ancylostoma caninum]
MLFFRLIGPQFLHKFQKKQAQRKPDLEAQRQAYALFYQNQAKQGKENGARFPNEEIPKKFVELRGFISPLGSRYDYFSNEHLWAKKSLKRQKSLDSVDSEGMTLSYESYELNAIIAAGSIHTLRILGSPSIFFFLSHEIM